MWVNLFWVDGSVYAILLQILGLGLATLQKYACQLQPNHDIIWLVFQALYSVSHWVLISTWEVTSQGKYSLQERPWHTNLYPLGDCWHDRTIQWFTDDKSCKNCSFNPLQAMMLCKAMYHLLTCGETRTLQGCILASTVVRTLTRHVNVSYAVLL